MRYIEDNYTVYYRGQIVGCYYIFSDGSRSYNAAYGMKEDLLKELRPFGLDKDAEEGVPSKFLQSLIKEENRVPGRKKILYENADFLLERESKETGERYSVYRRSAKKGDEDYSPLSHDAPHHEGPHTPEGMREWASWYAFNKMDDGTYEAELDEAWWWGGGHNDGGTIRRDIPEEWFALPYDEFLENVVTLAAALHYGFTAEILKEKKGLKEFFGFE